jgi:hypothetical protein
MAGRTGKLAPLRQWIAVFAFALGFALVTLPAAAQSASTGDRASMAGPWQGEWRGGGYVYEAEMTLEIAQDGQLVGAIMWTLRTAARENMKAKVGLSGTEYVRGRFDSAAKVLRFEGYRKDDPHTILGLDKYRLVVSDNGGTMGGVTHHHGPWNGVFFLQRVRRGGAESR